MPAHSDSDTGMRFGIGGFGRRRRLGLRRASVREHLVEALDARGRASSGTGLGAPGRAGRERHDRDAGVEARVPTTSRSMRADLGRRRAAG